MNPEQRFFVIHKYFPVEINIIFFAAFVWMLCPQRRRITDRYRAFHDLCFVGCRWNFNHFFFTVLIFFLFHLGVFMDMFNNRIGIQDFILRDRLIFRFCICFGYKNLYRHEWTVFLKDFADSVFIWKFYTIFVTFYNTNFTFYSFRSYTYTFYYFFTYNMNFY